LFQNGEKPRVGRLPGKGAVVAFRENSIMQRIENLRLDGRPLLESTKQERRACGSKVQRGGNTIERHTTNGRGKSDVVQNILYGEKKKLTKKKHFQGEV